MLRVFYRLLVVLSVFSFIALFQNCSKFAESGYSSLTSLNSLSDFEKENDVFEDQISEDEESLSGNLLVSQSIVSRMSSASVTTTLDQGRPLRLKTWLKSEGVVPKNLTYHSCEYSNTFSVHNINSNQNITGLSPESEYYIMTETSDSPGTGYADCPNMQWYQIGEIVEFTTKAQTDVVLLSLKDFNSSIAERDTCVERNWNGIVGSTYPPGLDPILEPKENQWTRVTIPPNGTVAASRKYILPEGVTEVWWGYDTQLGSTWTVAAGVKMPGIASATNSNYSGQAGGTGGGWAGLCRSFSNRGLMQTTGRMGWETYNLDSNNFGRVNGIKRVWGGPPELTGAAKDAVVESHILANHPCLESSNSPPTVKSLQQFGQTNIADPRFGVINDNKWHSVVHRLKLNTLPPISSMNDYVNAPRDGEAQLCIDGKLVMTRTGLNFTNNPEYYRLALFIQVYHGGSADTTGTEHDIFFANFRYTTNPAIGENL